MGGSSAEREGGGGEEEEEAARVLFLQSLSPVFVSHTLLLAMPSLLVLAGIMEKNGGYGGDLAGSGFGGEGLLVAPDEEEDDSRALRVALGQLSLLGLGEGEDGGSGGVPTAGVQDRSNNNNNHNHHHHHHHHANGVVGGGDAAILQGKSKLCALYESSSAETKGRGCNITECVPVPSSEHVAEIVGRQGNPLFPAKLPAFSPPDQAARLRLLFSNCYLLLFDKEKGVVCAPPPLFSFFNSYSFETSASHFSPLSFKCFKFSSFHTNHPLISRSCFLSFFFFFLERILRRREGLVGGGRGGGGGVC